MGIKFNCPNGHKLNVKAFLAGKKGVCPHCGVSFRIPGGDAGEENENASPGNVAPLGLRPANGSAVGATLPVGEPVAQPAIQPVVARAPAIPAAAPVNRQPQLPSPGPALPAGTTAPLATTVVRPAGIPVAAPVAPAIAPALPAGLAAGGDPIAEAPAAVWYVRPPTGGQYGPARGDVMRKWVGEGRVSNDSLVWREGWTDWRTAGQVFPSLAGPTGSPAAAGPAAVVVAATSSARSTSRTVRKRSNSGVAVALLVFLAILCVVLVGVLAYVLTTLK